MNLFNAGLRRRSEKVERVRSQARNLVDRINPFGTVTGRGFRIPLEKKVIELVEGTVKSYHKSRRISGSAKKQIFELMNRTDTRDFMTVLAQQLLREKAIQTEHSLHLLAAIKLASVASLPPKKDRRQRQSLAFVSNALADMAVELARKHGVDFAERLAKVLTDPAKSDAKQIVIDQEVDPVSNFYWNKYTALAGLLAEEAVVLGASHELAESFVLTAKYHLLFIETQVAASSSTGSALVNKVGYSSVLSPEIDYYQRLNRVLTANEMPFVPSYMTHISEPEGRINLSDLEKLSLSEYVGLTITYLLLMAWSVIILLPVFQVLILSFDGTRVAELGEAASVNNPAWIHYSNLFSNTNFKYWIANSLEVAGVTMLLTVVITTLLAYAFSRFRFRGRKTSLLSIMLLQLVPSVAALTAFLVLFSIMKEGVKIDTMAFLIIIYTGGALTGNTFILKGYMDSIPRDLDEAAELDGAGKFRVFWSILVPLCKPMIAIVALWSFIGPFGDVILPNLLNDGSLEGQKSLTMAAGLRTLITAGQGGVIQQYEYLAGAIITSVPIAVLFMFCQRFLVGGLTAGAVK